MLRIGPHRRKRDRNSLRGFREDETRSTMGKNPVVTVMSVIVATVAVIVLIFAVTRIINHLRPARAGTQMYVFWYDTGKRKLYPGALADVPPVRLPSGAEGVRAYVFAERDCSDPNDRFIGYLEKHLDVNRDVLMGRLTMSGGSRTELLQERLVRAPEEGSLWVKIGSPEGQRLLAVSLARKHCPEYVE